MERIRFVRLVNAAGWQWLVDATSQIGAVTTVLLALGVTALSALKLPHWWLGLVILGGLYGLLFAEGSYRVWREEDRRAAAVSERLDEVTAEPQPHLWFAEPEVLPADNIVLGEVPSSGQKVRFRTGSAVFARVNVVNDRPAGMPGATAQHVAATITFRADDGSHPVNEMLGRWAETPQRGETGRMGLSLDESQLDIAANSVRHPLDIAMKIDGDSVCFAYNHENSTAADLRLPKHALSDSMYLVRVTLRGANVDPISADYVLTNNPGVPLVVRGPYPPQDYSDLPTVASGVREFS